MAAILDQAGFAVLDEGAGLGGVIDDEAGAGTPVLFTPGPSRRLWQVARARNDEGAGMTLTQLAVSTEPVQVMISALLDGAAYNPTSDAAAMAFVVMPQYGAAAAPAASSNVWVTASWETDSNPASYWVTLLVGPNGGATTLTAGSYQVFIKVSDSSSGALPILTGPTLLVS